MSIVFPVIGAGFAAFCVWLGVRIYNRRERWAKRTALGLAIGVPLSYVLGLGPYIWLSTRDLLPDELPQIYMPVGWLYKEGPKPIVDGLDWYLAPWRNRRLEDETEW
jgi:hypothetical protein